jgi:hypothetical protein
MDNNTLCVIVRARPSHEFLTGWRGDIEDPPEDFHPSALLYIETNLSTACFQPGQVRFLQLYFVISNFGFYGSISASESSVSNAPIFPFPVGFLSLTAEDHLICRMLWIFPSGVVGGIFKPRYPTQQHTLALLTVIIISIVIPSFVVSRSRRVMTAQTSERFVLVRTDTTDASKNVMGGIFCSGAPQGQNTYISSSPSTGKKNVLGTLLLTPSLCL